MHEVTIPVPLSLAVECGVFKRAAELGLLTIGGIVVEQPRPLAKVASVPAPVARPARVRKPSKRSARKAKPAAPVPAPEPVKAPARAKKAKVQGVPATAQAVYDAIAAGAASAAEIRARAGLTGSEYNYVIRALNQDKIPGLRVYKAGDRSKARYGVTQAQADERYKAAMSPASEPRKSLAVKPIKRVRKVVPDAGAAQAGE